MPYKLEEGSYTDETITVTMSEDLHLYAKFTGLDSSEEGITFRTDEPDQYPDTLVAPFEYDEETGFYKGTVDESDEDASLYVRFAGKKGQIIAFDGFVATDGENEDEDTIDLSDGWSELPTGSKLDNDSSVLPYVNVSGRASGDSPEPSKMFTAFKQLDADGIYELQLDLCASYEPTSGKENSAWVTNFRILDAKTLSIRAEYYNNSTTKLTDEQVDVKAVYGYEDCNVPTSAEADCSFFDNAESGVKASCAVGKGIGVNLRAVNKVNKYTFEGWYDEATGEKLGEDENGNAPQSSIPSTYSSNKPWVPSSSAPRKIVAMQQSNLAKRSKTSSRA